MSSESALREYYVAHSQPKTLNTRKETIFLFICWIYCIACSLLVKNS